MTETYVPGKYVRIKYGRWENRVGIPVDLNGRYPVVDLDPEGRAKARRVRVRAVEVL